VRILTKSEKIELISKKIGKLTKGVTTIDDNIYMRKIQQAERKIMKNTTRKIGDEVLVNGFWVVIVELFDDGYAFVMDQDGEEFEVFLN